MNSSPAFLRHRSDRRSWGTRRALAGALLAASALPAAPVQPAAASPWPGDPNGLVFLWEDGSKTNQIPGAGGKAGRTCRAEPRGRATFGPNWDMDLAGGAFVTDAATDAALLAACRRTGQLTVEALVTPSKAGNRGPARVVSFAPDSGHGNFVLGQTGDRLVLRLKTSGSAAGPAVVLCRLVPDKPQHVLVTYRPGRLDCYRDGAPVAGTGALKGSLAVWTPQRLVFGGEARPDRATWAGRLEGIAVSSRFTTAVEAGRRFTAYAARLKGRKEPDMLVVQGVLAKKTAAPKLAAIAPYRRALVLNEYTVERVHRGVYAPKTIAVAEWAILDGKPLAETRRIGGSYRLHLVKFSDFPPLESERLVSESDEFDLDLYHAVPNP